MWLRRILSDLLRLSASNRWEAPEGYRRVLDPGELSGFAPGFSPDRKYHFLRYGEDRPKVYRLSDKPASFNETGLYFAEVGEG